MSLDAITKKMANLLEYVGILESSRQNCIERMKTDKLYRGSVLYYLYMMADSCVALAENDNQAQRIAQTAKLFGSHRHFGRARHSSWRLLLMSLLA